MEELSEEQKAKLTLPKPPSHYGEVRKEMENLFKPTRNITTWLRNTQYPFRRPRNPDTDEWLAKTTTFIVDRQGNHELNLAKEELLRHKIDRFKATSNLYHMECEDHPDFAPHYRPWWIKQLKALREEKEELEDELEEAEKGGFVSAQDLVTELVEQIKGKQERESVEAHLRQQTLSEEDEAMYEGELSPARTIESAGEDDADLEDDAWEEEEIRNQEDLPDREAPSGGSQNESIIWEGSEFDIPMPCDCYYCIEDECDGNHNCGNLECEACRKQEPRSPASSPF